MEFMFKNIFITFFTLEFIFFTTCILYVKYNSAVYSGKKHSLKILYFSAKYFIF